MLKNLKLLLSIRAWLKSRTLNLSAILIAISGWDIAAGGNLVETVVGWIMALGFSNATALAILVAIKALADAALRAKTDRSLQDK